MSQSIIDPISYSNSLQEAGMPRAQADIIAKNQQTTIERLIDMRDFATKQDLRLALAELKADLVKWFLGTTLAILGIMVAGFAMVISLIR